MTSRRAGPAQAARACGALGVRVPLAHGATPAARRTRVPLEMADPAKARVAAALLGGDGCDAVWC
jgi:hypothetical protein